MNNKDTKYFIYIAIGLIAYIGLVLIQFSMESNTFSYIGISIILFIISLIIGLFIQKIQMRGEFQERLRSKAIGAIRRLSDIEILVKRGLTKTSNETDNVSYTVFEIINDSVRSAKYDWADVLEEDFKNIQEIEEKKVELIKALSFKKEDKEEQKNQIIKLKNEISKLKNSIPQTLYSSVTRTQLAEMQLFKTQEFLNDIASRGNEYEILIEVLDPKLYSIINQKESLSFRYEYKTGQTDLFVVCENNFEHEVGRVINKFKEFGVSDANYSQWLYETLYVNRNNDIKVLDEYNSQQISTGSEDVITVKIPISKLFFAVG